MGIQADFNLSMRITKPLIVGGQQLSVTLESGGPVGSLNESTTPKCEKAWKGQAISVNGDVLLDLTALEETVESGGVEVSVPVSFTNKKVLQAKFRTAADNTVPITVSAGDTNGYPIGTRIIYADACDGFNAPNNPTTVTSTRKIIKLSSASTASIDVLLVAGT